MLNINNRIAEELDVKPSQIEAAIKLLNEGATVPFIARYRKEATEGLTDEQLRELETRYQYLTDLEDRKASILESIRSQGKLTPELESQIQNCLVKADLEYLYIPFRPKRVTRATKAREAGLEPLALELWISKDVNLDLDSVCNPYISDNYKTTKELLEACNLILIDNFADNADLLAELKSYLQAIATVEVKVSEGKEQEADKFKDYFDYSEALCDIRNHRFLAIWRGRAENYLNVHLNPNPYNLAQSPVDEIIYRHATKDLDLDLTENTPLNIWRRQVLNWTWRVKLSGILETELLNIRREQAEPGAYSSFAQNLKALLLKSPVKAQNIIGLDPGIRTGIKCAVIDSQTNLLATDTLYAFSGSKDSAKAKLLTYIQDYNVTLIVIGNGTASRETLEFAESVISSNKLKGVYCLVVNEAGASVYSASDLAQKEFPDLDVSLRGAVSIARRALDPLAELVKIDPKSIGVGQYQHDLNQKELSRQLEATIEDCVNYVGVNVNTASEYLLNRISGLNRVTAANIVKYREENGLFKSRKEILKVNKLGPKAFEQCAGFLRVVGDDAYVLDNSSVHPEAYPLVELMAKDLNVDLKALVGNKELLDTIKPEDYVTDKFGLLTVNDILKELEKPGRDPRGDFQQIEYLEGVDTVKKLQVGMVMNGVVTNVTDFGCFVDIGVHTDGLVHISRMSSQYIASPYDFVKPGMQVRVKVHEVDVARNRIDLSMIFEGQEQKAISSQVSRLKSAEEAAQQEAIVRAQAEYIAKMKAQGLEVSPESFKLYAKAQRESQKRERAANFKSKTFNDNKERKGFEPRKGNSKQFKSNHNPCNNNLKDSKKVAKKVDKQSFDSKLASLLNRFGK